MKCSKCGYERQRRDDAFVPLSECPACGVIYTKHDLSNEPTKIAGVVPSPHLKPSPVDAASLRKARERVDKRLRERLGARIKDKRHAQTLELARRLTAEQIRKRQDEWKRIHPDKSSSPQTSQKPASAVPAMESQASGADPAQPSRGDLSKDHPAIGAAQAEAEKMTLAEKNAPETVDPPTLPVEKISEPACKSGSAAAEPSPVDEEAVLLDDIVVDARAEPVAEGQTEAHQVLETARQDYNEGVSEPEHPVSAARPTASASRHWHDSGRGNGLARLLPVVAWLILVAGVIGAVLSWISIGDVEAGIRIPIPESTNTLPLGLLLGFAYLATGVLGFAFFWVSSLISNQLRDIRRLLMYEDRGRDRTQKAKI